MTSPLRRRWKVGEYFRLNPKTYRVILGGEIYQVIVVKEPKDHFNGDDSELDGVLYDSECVLARNRIAYTSNKDMLPLTEEELKRLAVTVTTED